MATIYFSSTASSGDGTLRDAITAAGNGDVIMPDPAVFNVGESVTVNASSTINVTANVILDAGGTRLTVKHPSGIVMQARAADGISEFEARGVTFVGRVIVAGTNAQTVTASFSRCTFGSNSASAYLFQSSSGYAALTFNDCLFTGSMSYAFYLSGTGTSAFLNRCTIAGNVSGALNGNAASSAVITDCVIPTDLSTEYTKFANAPSDVSGYSASNLPPWQEWNWAPLPGSDYATGATTAAGEYDLLNNKRGWVVMVGSVSYAQGAIETVSANYFQTNFVNPSFRNPSDWSTDRGGKTPATSLDSPGVFYVSDTSAFSDAPGAYFSVLIQGQSEITFAGADFISKLQTNKNVALNFTSDQAEILFIQETSLGAGASIRNAVGAKANGALKFETLAKEDGDPVSLSNSGLISIPTDADESFFDYPDRVVKRGAGITSVDATITGSTVSVDVERTQEAGDVFFDARAFGDANFYRTLGYEGVTLDVSFSDKAIQLRAFDGETFITLTVPRTYYYIGGENGSFTTATDWSTTYHGTALSESPTVENCSFIIP